jgi:hypothetical protein
MVEQKMNEFERQAREMLKENGIKEFYFADYRTIDGMPYDSFFLTNKHNTLLGIIDILREPIDDFMDELEEDLLEYDFNKKIIVENVIYYLCYTGGLV